MQTIKNEKEELKQDARETLYLALEQDFESVIVFGFKDNEIHTIRSRTKKMLEIIGALEAAKAALLER